jgi:purine-binding chemotaxis protein CheW
VDLRIKLGLPPIEQTPSTRIIILDVPLNGRPIGVGFIADRVFEVAGIDQDQTEAAPEVGGRWRSHYIARIARKSESFVIIFDLGRLMASDEAALLTTTYDVMPAVA